MKLKNIYVVRHGETDWNKNQKFQGRTDIKLNELGREQSLSLKPFMQQLQIEAVYSSTLSRAIETAEIATQDLKLPIQKEERLCETNIGILEGLVLSEIIEKFGEESLIKWRSYEERLLDFHFEKGESKRQLMYRLRQVFLEIAQNSVKNNIAVFTHGMLMRAMTFVFGSGVNWDHHTFSNGSIHHFVWLEDQAERLTYKGKIK